MNEAEKTAGCPTEVQQGLHALAETDSSTTKMRDLQNLWMEVKTDKEREDR